MRKRYGETAEQAAERFIKECRECAALFPVLRRVILKFDGKVYNKRFGDALQAENNRLHCEKKTGANCERIGVYYYTESGDMRYVMWCPISEDKRINAADMIQNAAEKRAEILQEAAHMEEIIPTIETRKQQIDILKRQFSALLDDLTYTERDIFNFNYQVRNC